MYYTYTDVTRHGSMRQAGAWFILDKKEKTNNSIPTLVSVCHKCFCLVRWAEAFGSANKIQKPTKEATILNILHTLLLKTDIVHSFLVVFSAVKGATIHLPLTIEATESCRL